MAGTFAQLQFHIIFSTKDRTPSIHPAWRPRFWEYLGGIVVGEGGTPLQIGGMADHVQLLVTLRPRHHLPDFIQKLKAGSSGWVHREFPEAGMWWQNG
jgi:REP element-mobilizing transposase RayT